MWRSLRELLSERRKQSPNKPQYDAAMAVQIFQEYVRARVPKEIQGRPRAKKLVDGILTVEVSHPALAQLLRHEEGAIIHELSARGCRVRGLVFTVRQGTTEWSG